MELTGERHQKLTKIFAKAFPSKQKLTEMLQYKLNKNLEDITTEDGLGSIVFELIKAAKAEGWLKDLIFAAQKQNPGNEDLANSNLIPNNLPKRIRGKLIGREKDLQNINESLTTPDCSLISLVGQGGAGKTQLALHLAKKQLIEGNFFDGVFFIEFETLIKAEDVPSAIYHTLNSESRVKSWKEITGFSLSEDKVKVQSWKEIIDRVGGKQILLVLDNLEHLIAEIGFDIKYLIEECSNLKLLLTSREKPRLKEKVFEIDGLTLPKEKELTDDFESYAAIGCVDKQSQKLHA